MIVRLRDPLMKLMSIPFLSVISLLNLTPNMWIIKTKKCIDQKNNIIRKTGAKIKC